MADPTPVGPEKELLPEQLKELASRSLGNILEIFRAGANINRNTLIREMIGLSLIPGASDEVIEKSVRELIQFLNDGKGPGKILAPLPGGKFFGAIQDYASRLTDDAAVEGERQRLLNFFVASRAALKPPATPVAGPADIPAAGWSDEEIKKKARKNAPPPPEAPELEPDYAKLTGVTLDLKKFDPDEALLNTAFMRWVREAETEKLKLPFTAAELQAGKNLDEAARFYTAFEARPFVQSRLMVFTRTELAKLGTIPAEVISGYRLSGSIEGFLADKLLKDPEVIIKIAKLIEEHGENSDTIDELEAEIEALEKKVSKERKEAKEHSKSPEQLEEERRERQLLATLVAMGRREPADVIDLAIGGAGALLGKMKLVDFRRGDNRFGSGLTDFFGQGSRTEREAKAFEEYEAMRVARGQKGPVTRTEIEDRFNQLTHHAAPLGRSESEVNLEAKGVELAGLSAGLAVLSDEAAERLGIAKLVKRAADESIPYYLTTVIMPVEGADDVKKREKAVPVLQKVRELRGSADARFHKAIDSALTQLEALVQDGIIEEMNVILRQFKGGDAEALMQSLHEFVIDPFTSTASDNPFGIAKSEYRKFLVETLDAAATKARKEGNKNKAGLLREIEDWVKHP